MQPTMGTSLDSLYSLLSLNEQQKNGTRFSASLAFPGYNFNPALARLHGQGCQITNKH